VPLPLVSSGARVTIKSNRERSPLVWSSGRLLAQPSAAFGELSG
jgi:hypothetical protein